MLNLLISLLLVLSVKTLSMAPILFSLFVLSFTFIKIDVPTPLANALVLEVVKVNNVSILLASDALDFNIFIPFAKISPLFEYTTAFPGLICPGSEFDR